MPTAEQIETATRRIEWLKSMSFLQEEGRMPETASDATLPWWEDLAQDEQQAVLASDVNWTGFSQAQESDVIRRVVADEEPEFWMDGIEPDPPSPEEVTALASEIKQDERAARVRDSEPEWFGDFSAMMAEVAVPRRFDEAAGRMGPEPDRTPEQLSGDRHVAPPETEVYRVYHAHMPAGIGEPPVDFPEGFLHAADVHAKSLGDAVALTTHIDKPWAENPGVETKDGFRSTLIGDVVVDPNGQAHRFEEQGFHPIGREPSGYDRQLREAADRGRFQKSGPDKGHGQDR